MKVRSRIFLGILLVVGIGFYFLIDWIMEDLKPEYRKATEEPLVDTARVLAALAASTAIDGQVNKALFESSLEKSYAEEFTAQIYDYTKSKVDFHIYITDKAGVVLFDSHSGEAEGEDFSSWRDVHKTLSGDYGARTTRDVEQDPASSVMYVAAPIVLDGKLIGVLSVGKPSLASNRFIEASKRRTLVGVAVIACMLILVSVVVSTMVTNPIKRLTGYAKAVSDGKRVPLPPLGKSEVRELGDAFEEMRDALEGKQYVENYVQTLTHEVKSPLSAIQGALELLKEEMPEERREQFLDNIYGETARIKIIVERLLLLSSMENKKSLEEVEGLNLYQVVQDAYDSLSPLFEAKNLSFDLSGETKSFFLGERFLIQQAVANLLKNAVEFSPDGGSVRAEITKDCESVQLLLKDEGPGIPDYALERVFERFYSLERPDSGKKSSGLGLSLVQEAAALHGGSVELVNAGEKGAVAKLLLPLGQT